MTPGIIIAILFAGAILGVATFKVVGYVKERIAERTQEIKTKREYEHRALHSKEILHQEIEQITKTEPISQDDEDENVIKKEIEKYL